MRIGLVAPPWFPVPPGAYGGIEAVVDLLARGFADAGHEVLLAAPAGSECPVPLVQGTEPASPEELGNGLREIAHVIRAYEMMEDMDVIHDHTLAGILYAHRAPRVPYATTIHGPLTPDLTAIYRKAAADTAVVAISHDQVSRTPDLAPAAVIHHGIDVEKVPYGAGKGEYVCFLGRMCPDKGVAEAIAVSRMAGIPLKIAAKMREPAERCYFREVIQPMLGPDAEYLGEAGPAEKYALLGDALALLNPIQWSEPFGLVMIEALAAGTPVVATPRGSAPEIVQHGVTGFLASTLPQLADLLPAAASLRRSTCRAVAAERFCARRMVEDYLRLFTRLSEGERDVGADVRSTAQPTAAGTGPRR